jgi:very-short-patch-repair endonuclease
MSDSDQSASPLSRSRERVRVRARGLRKSSSDAENEIWRALRNRQLGGYKFRRQHPVAGYFADFACVEECLIVELDGGQHFEPDAIQLDIRRTAVLNQSGFHVLRFNNREALTERDAVLSCILRRLQANRPHPTPLPQAGEGAQPIAGEQFGEHKEST